MNFMGNKHSDDSRLLEKRLQENQLDWFYFYTTNECCIKDSVLMREY